MWRFDDFNWFILLRSSIFDKHRVEPGIVAREWAHFPSLLDTIIKNGRCVAILKRIYNKMKVEISKHNRSKRRELYRLRLNNKGFTLLSSNCIGGTILNDLEQPFLTPTINLYFSAEDFVKLLERPKYYLDLQVKEPVEHKTITPYPIGLIDDITIHFVHYDSFKEASEKWETRKRRINWANLFIMMTDRDGCTENIIKRFSNSPYKNKVIFTSKKYIEYDCAFCLHEFQNQQNVGVLTDFNNINGTRYYDTFDFVHWLNTGEIKGTDAC